MPESVTTAVPASRLLSGAGRAASVALALLPGALIVYLSFNGGGFFAGTTGFVAAALGVVLVLRITLADRPFAGLEVRGFVVAGALALLAVWVYASAAWSDTPARALIEFDRVLLYLFGLLLGASVMASRERWRLTLWGLAGGILIVAGIALITRVLPDVWPIAASLESDRLSYPLTYWNALGLLCAVGFVLCFHLAAANDDRPASRVLGAAALPVLATALYFTFSRGSIAAGVVGLLAYVVLARSRGIVSALVAGAPTVAIAVVFAYRADLLSSTDFTTPAAVDQGRTVFLVVVVCVLAAAALRLATLRLDERLARARVSPEGARRAVVVAGAIGVLALVIGSVAWDAPGAIARQYDRFVDPAEPDEGGDLRARLVSPANNGRLDHWRVSIDSFRRDPIQGSGAGTYETEWARDRPTAFTVIDGHSLYVETLGELGVIGLALTLLAVGGLLVGLATRIRGPGRATAAAVFGAVLVWALHAGIDWDWEMPATTLWAFMVGGVVLARPVGEGTALGAPGRTARIVVALGVIVLAVTPALMALSQRDLDASVRAFERGDCATAIDRALASRDVLGTRPEPYEILGYCDARIGRPDLAVRMFEEAVERDRNNWALVYGLALARAQAGLDPRPDMRRALQLNPKESLTIEGVERFENADTPQEWKRRAVGARLPIT